MIANFQVKETFKCLSLTLSVDCEARGAELLVIFDRRVRRTEKVSFDLVSDPIEAERWLRRDMGQTSSFVEHVEWLCRHSALAVEKLAA